MKSNMEQYWSGKNNPQKEDLIKQYWSRIQQLEGKVTEMNSEISTLKAMMKSMDNGKSCGYIDRPVGDALHNAAFGNPDLKGTRRVGWFRHGCGFPLGDQW